jgi:hypothetical protein
MINPTDFCSPFVTLDNGYIQFTNVRIPRAYMLMKHTQVTREGKVFEPPLAQLTCAILICTLIYENMHLTDTPSNSPSAMVHFFRGEQPW